MEQAVDQIPWWAYLLGGGLSLSLLWVVYKILSIKKPADNGNGISLKISEAEWRGQTLQILKTQAENSTLGNNILRELKTNSERSLRLLIKADKRSQGVQEAIQQISQMYHKTKKRDK